MRYNCGNTVPERSDRISVALLLPRHGSRRLRTSNAATPYRKLVGYAIVNLDIDKFWQSGYHFVGTKILLVYVLFQRTIDHM